MTAINQDTGEPDKLGPLEILRAYPAPRSPTNPTFGQLMVALQPGKIHVGDKVQVLEKRKQTT